MPTDRSESPMPPRRDGQPPDARDAEVAPAAALRPGDLRRRGRPLVAEAPAGRLQPERRRPPALELRRRRLRHRLQGRPRRVDPRSGPATGSRSSPASRSTRGTGPTSPGRSSTSRGAFDDLGAYDAAQGEARRGRPPVRHPGQPGLLPVDPAAAGPGQRRAAQGGRDGQPARRGPGLHPGHRREADRPRPGERPRRSTRRSPTPSTRARPTGSTTTSARRPSRTCWSSGSPTASSSRSGTRSTSTTSRSPWPRRRA